VCYHFIQLETVFSKSVLLTSHFYFTVDHLTTQGTFMQQIIGIIVQFTRAHVQLQHEGSFGVFSNDVYNVQLAY
jgi:hypothetical protein